MSQSCSHLAAVSMSSWNVYIDDVFEKLYQSFSEIHYYDICLNILFTDCARS